MMMCRMCRVTRMVYMTTMSFGHAMVEFYYCPKCDRVDEGKRR